MNTTLLAITIISVLTAFGMLLLWAADQRKMRQLRKLKDAQKHLKQCEIDAEESRREAVKHQQDTARLKKQFQRYRELTGIGKSISDNLEMRRESKTQMLQAQQELQRKIAQQSEEIRDATQHARSALILEQKKLERFIGERHSHIAKQTAAAQEGMKLEQAKLAAAIADRHEQIARQTVDATMSLKLEEDKLAASIAYRGENIAQATVTAQKNLKALNASITELEAQYEMNLSLVESGFYKRHFNYNTTAKFKSEIGIVVEKWRESTKQAMSLENVPTAAAVFAKRLPMYGTDAEVKKMMKATMTLFVRAFNKDCDAALASIRYGNYGAIEKKFHQALKQINKIGSSKGLSISEYYFDLRLTELRLNHEMELRKQEEKERQREARELAREEEKARREWQEEVDKAEAEEKAKREALDRARRELSEQHGVEKDALQRLVDQLQIELAEASDRKDRAVSNAQLTRAGNVYVISNIGCFGEDLFKIGLTRRKDPMDRVNELGNASVPFRFDVHAMIWSEDAPSLETALHKHFDHRRVNKVNTRKEFFHVTIEEIAAAVKKFHGEVTFVTQYAAEQYRKSLALANTNLFE